MNSFKSNVAEPPGKKAAAQATPSLRRFSHLSASRQALVRLCQATNYGLIRNLEVRDSEPVFSPPPVVAVDVKLDADEGPRPELDLTDFVLKAELCRLLDLLDEFQTATIEHIEVRVGIPRRVIFKISLEAFAIDAHLTTRTGDQQERDQGGLPRRGEEPK